MYVVVCAFPPWGLGCFWSAGVRKTAGLKPVLDRVAEDMQSAARALAPLVRTGCHQRPATHRLMHTQSHRPVDVVEVVAGGDAVEDACRGA